MHVTKNNAYLHVLAIPRISSMFDLQMYINISIFIEALKLAFNNNKLL